MATKGKNPFAGYKEGKESKGMEARESKGLQKFEAKKGMERSMPKGKMMPKKGGRGC